MANGRRRAVTAGWQLRAGSSRGLRGLGCGLGGVELGHELLGPGLDARLDLPPEILARDGKLVPRAPRLDLHQGHRRIPAAVKAHIALGLRQRTQSPHVPQRTTRPGRCLASETMQAVAVRTKQLRYAVDLTTGGELTDENGVVLDVPTEWSPEHLLLAGLIRCSLKSLRYHADRMSVAVGSVSANSRTLVTKRETDGRYALVETEVELAVALDPEPEPDALSKLLELAERDCFVGSSLTAKPSYRWIVNGRAVA